MIDTIGLVANIITVLTIYLHTRKKWYGPVSGVIAELVWLYYAYLLGAWPIGISTVVMGVIYMFAVPKWYRERHSSTIN